MSDLQLFLSLSGLCLMFFCLKQTALSLVFMNTLLQKITPESTQMIRIFRREGYAPHYNL